jgi:F0F1-type ATP synthase assembly protein I
MTTAEQMSKNQDERDEARQDLRDTLAEVNAKVERAGGDLRPEHLVEAHPIAACLLAGALGALFGTNVKSSGTGPIIIATLLGVALSIRSSGGRSECDGRETSSTD